MNKEARGEKMKGRDGPEARKARVRKEPSDEQKELRTFRKKSERHVLEIEAAMTEDEKRKVFHEANKDRLLQNAMTGEANKRLEQIHRTKQYRKLLEMHAATKDAECKKDLGEQLSKTREDLGLTKDAFEGLARDLRERFGVSSVQGLVIAERVWGAAQKVLFGDAKQLHFRKRGDLPPLRGKQANRELVLSADNGCLWVKWNGITFTHVTPDLFQSEEIDAIVRYLSDPDAVEKKAIALYKEDGRLSDTFRPCYVSLVCREIRGRLRVYIQITLEGKAKSKKRVLPNGITVPRHSYGTGSIGGDIGTQTIAYASDSECGLRNLAERTARSIRTNEKREARLLRQMDSSRRETNPERFNEDGTYKKGTKGKWKKSKKYLKLQKRLKNRKRVNAVNRHLAIREEVNHLRSLGDTFITEPKNAAKLAKRAKETTYKEDGTPNRKKRFGKSIQNRCPGYFQARMEQVFKSTGGNYYEVPCDYRASQHDHTSDAYVKKDLSTRMYSLSDGTVVQRDLYSAYLLFCFDPSTKRIDKTKCGTRFEAFHVMHDEVVDAIRMKHLQICNSGI